MKFVFLGPPGAGKGTLAVKIANYYGIPHISTGEMFRAAIQAHTELGREIEEVINSGGLVDDDATVALVKERLSCTDAFSGFVLDGFPRTLFQAEQLALLCKLDAVIDFVISDAVVITRLSGRRICTICGANFHVDFMKPRTDGVCDVCDTKLIIREDDKKTAIMQRLETYRKRTLPLIDFYKNKGLLVPLKADVSPEEVLDAFIKRFPRTKS